MVFSVGVACSDSCSRAQQSAVLLLVILLAMFSSRTDQDKTERTHQIRCCEVLINASTRPSPQVTVTHRHTPEEARKEKRRVGVGFPRAPPPNPPPAFPMHHRAAFSTLHESPRRCHKQPIHKHWTPRSVTLRPLMEDLHFVIELCRSNPPRRLWLWRELPLD